MAVSAKVGGHGKSILCHICASTMLSHCVSYPELYGENRHLFGSIGWIANHLQDEIRKLSQGAPSDGAKQVEVNGGCEDVQG